jgi:hypothetical protein
MIEQRVARRVLVQVQTLHVGVWLLAAQVAHGRSDDEASGVADGDPARLGSGFGGSRGLGGRAEQRTGAWQENLTGLGEAAALRGAVK